jgi:hypothetical protein
MAVQDVLASIAPDEWLPDPGSTFRNPEDVLTNAELTIKRKVDILQRWAYDAREAAVAEEEGMLGDDDDLQRRTLLALEQVARWKVPTRLAEQHCVRRVIGR